MGKLVSQADLKHELVVSEKAWYVKLYVWLWDANKKDITICKMFWGYVFLWVALVLHVVIAFIVIYDRSSFAEKRRLTKAAYYEEHAGYKVRKPKEPKPKAQWLVSTLDKIEWVMNKIGMVFRTKVMSYLFITLGVLVALGLFAFVVVFCVKAPIITAIVFGCLIVAALVLSGALWAIDNINWDPFGRRVSNGALSFAGLMAGGYRAVKTNTCPRITLKD